ncbi:hypothetical protein H7U19_14805 [Hyunsoonleella sp. SJ7]|uniref:Uncharacterized protein n=1 Tax=Hyunsoonleella aquatilis TaxID=2762758 RepID=A0A923KH45_9FLAO|nr:hypothetical protein [Hyunsoonleella aquatilis]MBC3759681.1 hypothetical protein [Hyunsoonleella aquatilis]
MKKLGLLIVGFIIGAVLTYYFCPREAAPNTEMEDKMEIVKPKGVISVAEAKLLNDNWTKLRKSVLDSITERSVGKEDNRSTWWSIDDVEKYIGYAKSEASKSGNTLTGLRVYLGVYGSNAGESKKDLTTMFVVPTGEKSTSEASFINFSLQNNNDLPIPPLNEGGGSPPPYNP